LIIKFFYRTTFKKDILFLTLEEFNNKYSTKLNFLQYNSIISSIRKYTNSISIEKQGKKHNFQPALNIILTTKSGTSPIYNKFIIPEANISGFRKWSQNTGISKDEWLDSFVKLIATTNDPKLRWIQSRILHHILTTNRSVSKYTHNQTDLCSFCNLKSETILHIFWECTKTKIFWNNLETTFNNRCSHSVNFRFTKSLILFGHCEIIRTDKICDFIILMAKFFIYRCKVQNINLNSRLFLIELYNRYKAEFIISKNRNQLRNGWAPYQNMFKAIL